jgi:5-methylcytosine-specific restriction endonuclease McrA
MPYTFTDEDRAKIAQQRKEAVLKDLSEEGSYRSNCYLNRIIKEFSLLEYKCSECGIANWRDKDISLELDHIDGNAHNCKLSNLRYVCPNCHSQTKTYKGRSINTGKKRISDEELIASLKESPNVRQALIRVGLAPRGGNYTRAARLKTQI